MSDRLFSALDRALWIATESLANEGLAWLASEPRTKMAALRSRGPLPALSASTAVTARPITLVAVRYDDLCAHNLLESPDLADPPRRLILVDDPSGLRYRSIASALAAGLAAIDALVTGAVVLIGQDVWLPGGWPLAVESALASLEKADPDWGVAGVAGTDLHGRRIGHVSDPWGRLDTFEGQALWAEAESLEDGVLLFQAGDTVPLDPELPGFEGLGSSVSRAIRASGRRCYVIDAPAVVERADHLGRPVTRALASRRVRGQFYRQHRAQRQVTLEYLSGPVAASTSAAITAPLRWPSAPRRRSQVPSRSEAPAISEALSSPLVLLGKGGGGSRLLTLIAADCGVFVGRVNTSGDCLDMVPAIYSGVLRAFDCRAAWQRDRVVEGLREGAAAMLTAGWKAGTPWGFKVPEALLIVEQIHAAFPRARFLLMTRHPVSTCLRRSHITAEPDNPIGRVSLSAAYRAACLEPETALADPVEVRSAMVTRHQVGTAVRYLRDYLSSDRYLEIRFEDVVARPEEAREEVAGWLGLDVVSRRLERAVNLGRAAEGRPVSVEIVRRVEHLLAALTMELGYEPLPRSVHHG
jgi:hypothetical protein